MREIKVLVTLQVDECDPAVKIGKAAMENAAVEAIKDAVKRGEDNGFNHSLADEICIGVADVEICKD